MPNWCENDLFIIGLQEDIAEVLKLIGADQEPPCFYFNKVIPIDDENFYKASSLWGTKWNSNSVSLEKHFDINDFFDYVRISFFTAWSPPIPIIRELSKKFPKVDFEIAFFECRTQICGGCTFLRKDRRTERGLDHDTDKPDCQWQGVYEGIRGG